MIGYLSGACWFFAKNTYDQYKVPLGLIVSNYGGTAVEWLFSPSSSFFPFFHLVRPFLIQFILYLLLFVK
jgi:hypothetical protein